MKGILRRFSHRSIDTPEKENNEIVEITDDPFGLLNNNIIPSQTTHCMEPMIGSKMRTNSPNGRKYSLPSKVLSKLFLQNLLTRKRSTSTTGFAGVDEKTNDNERHIDRHYQDPHENVKSRIDEVRLRPLQYKRYDVRRESSDVPLLCHRLSEINVSPDYDQRRAPFPSFSSNRISRLSVADMDKYQTMSNREKRLSLSDFGFGKVESYIKYEVLGKGTYSTVFKGQSLLTNDIVALKEMKLEEAEGAPCTAIREISLLRDLRHPNIVTLHDIIYQRNRLTLIFEYMERNLKQYMEERDNNIDKSTIKSFMRQLLSGLDFCHNRRILHRDLKPQNLLINEKDELKLADFGLARAKSFPIKTYSSEVVTLWYRPPDLLLGKTDYSGHIDIWGAGCIFVEMMNGMALFPGHTEKYQLKLIFEKLGSLSSEEWDSLKLKNPRFQYNEFIHAPKPSSLIYLVRRHGQGQEDTEISELLAGFLHLVGENRFTANVALQHSYFFSSSRKLSTCNPGL